MNSDAGAGFAPPRQFHPRELLVLLPLLLAVLLAGIRLVANTDLGFHLSAGRWMVEHLDVPRMDFLAFTAAGHRWLNFEWLYALVSFGAWNLTGPAGITLMHAALNVGTFFLLWRCAARNGERVPAAGFLLLLALTVAEIRFSIRPHAVERLMMAGFLSCLLSARKHGRMPWLLIGLQVLWCNLHGSHLVAVGFGFLWSLDRFLAGERSRRILLLPALLVLAGFLTPYGPGQSVHLLLHLKAVSTFAANPEWMPLHLTPGVLRDPAFACFVLLVGLAGWRLWFSTRDQGLFLWLLLTWSVIAPFIHARMLALSAIQLAFICFEAGPSGRIPLPGLIQRLAFPAASATPLLLAALFATGAFWNWAGRNVAPGFGVSASTPGWLAGSYLSQLPVKKVFNTYRTGGWLGYWLSPGGGQVFIDGRDVGNVFTPAHLVEYRRLLADPSAFVARLQSGSWDAVVLEPEDPLCHKAILAMRGLPGWKLAFLDPWSCVFVRRDLLEGVPARPVSGRFWEWTRFPAVWEHNPFRLWGTVLSRCDLGGEAEDAFVQSLAIDANDVSTLRFLGTRALGAEQFDKAAGYLQRAAGLASGHGPTHMNLAVACMRLGRVEEAVEHGEYSVHYAPGDPVAWLNLAQYYAASGNQAQAERCNRIARAVQTGRGL